MKSNLKDPKKLSQLGRIRPFVLGLTLLILGIVFDKWWWGIGLLIIIVLFIEAYFRYRPMD